MSGIAIRLHAFVSMLWQDIKDERGQDLLEYALIGGFIAAVLVAGFTILITSGAVDNMFTSIANCLDFDGATECTISGP